MKPSPSGTKNDNDVESAEKELGKVIEVDEEVLAALIAGGSLSGHRSI